MRIQAQDKIAVYQNQENLSYRDFIGRCRAFAQGFSLSQEEKVGIISENRSEWLLAFYAIWLNEGTVVPIDFMSTVQEIIHVLQDAEIAYLFVSPQCMAQAQEAVKKSGRDITIYEIEAFAQNTRKKFFSHEQGEKDLEFADDDMTAVMIYTSGTTGKPKGVMLTRKNFSANIEGILALGVFQTTDIYGALLPFHHVYPLTGTLLMPLCSQASLAIIEKLSSEAIGEAFRKYKITILFGIPRIYNIFHQGIFNKIQNSFITRTFFSIAKILPSMAIRKKIFAKVHKNFGGNLRYFLSGGSKIEAKVMSDFAVLGIPMVEGYGLSETSPLCSTNGSPGVFKKGTIGKAISNVEIKIVDGEICARGDNIMKGYYKRLQETQEVLKDGWFYTGDAGSMDKQGYVTISGRKRELIVLPNGKKFNPEEVEKNIAQIHPEMIQEVGVFAQGNGLFALVVPNFEFLTQKNLANAFETVRWQIIDKYNRTARDYKKVLDFKLIADELPRTRIGKPKRFLFPALASEQEEKKRKHPSEPSGANYAQLKSFLQNLSGKTVYPDSCLELDLGFDSLARIETESFFESKFLVSITPEQLSGDTTVQQLYNLICETEKNQDGQTEASVSGWAEVLQQKQSHVIKNSSFFLHMAKIFLTPLFLFYVRLTSKGLQKSFYTSHNNNNAVLFTPNHQSYLDAPALVASLPHKVLAKTFFIGNNRHFTSPFNRWLAQNSNMLIIDINLQLKESMQKIAFLLKQKKNVVIFPEGARTRDGQLMEFKKFFAILSKELEIAVVPVTIKGTAKLLPLDASFPYAGKISVNFSEPLELFDKSYEEICTQVKEVIATELNRKT